MEVTQINLKKGMTVSELLAQYKASGVLGAGRVSRASNLLVDMFEDDEMNIFMSLAGPMVPGGLRNIVANLIREKRIRVLMTSGANITHDLLEAFGGRHYKDLGNNDEELNDAGIGRIADVYTASDDFEVFETEMIKIFTQISEELDNDEDQGIISIQGLLKRVGEIVDDDNCILTLAARNGVDIFSPGLIDSMFGLQLWMFTQDHKLVVDAVGDMHYLSDIVFESERIGAIMLGGGVPKHYTLASSLLKGGIDAGIQITMDRPETGSLSGAPLQEAKSWSKAKHGSNLVNVIGDVTIIFPLIVASALDKINDE
ncbi:MAG: deoxyhypusine synthase [archaeon]|nr:deoxyhypusine synthase [archaeon]